MKLINSKAKLIPQKEDLQGIYEQIELAGRTCYKSESNIKYQYRDPNTDKVYPATTDNVEELVYFTNGGNISPVGSCRCTAEEFDKQYPGILIKESISAKDFVERMIKSGHLAMLEHATVYLMIPLFTNSENMDIVECYINNPYSKVNISDDLSGYPTYSSPIIINPIRMAYITTNYRVIEENEWYEDLDYLSDPTKYHEKRYTVKFTTDIGVSREANRHRVNSIAEQSTRYCNFSKDKFNNEISICLNEDIKDEDIIKSFSKWTYPEEQDTMDLASFYRMCNTIGTDKGDTFNAVDTWLFANLACQWSYMKLLKLGWKPQQARRVLPLDLQTEIVHTAFESDWKHFMDLRYYGTTGAPHPDMLQLATKIKEEFDKENITI